MEIIMVENLDPVLLARIQFAFTISFHIIFPSFTIGLASWLAVVEWRLLKTGNKIYEEIYRMWVKIFAVTFGMGIVSGVVMSYQFGTNWSVFSDKVGNVIGPLLGYEVLTAFFLEASFLGIISFGFHRYLHFHFRCRKLLHSSNNRKRTRRCGRDLRYPWHRETALSNGFGL
jgi:cytochrome d ubiquinol oxidase subunit I